MKEYLYAVTCSYDGKAPHWTARFDNALDAVNSYLSFRDWGFADEFATVNLSEPTGKMHTKNLYRTGLVTTK
jgi:hypothetical protein